ASNFESTDSHLRALLLEFLADKLVRRRDAHSTFHAGSRFERFQASCHVANADHSNDHALFTLDRVDLIAEFTNPLADVVNLFSGGMGAHRNNHGCKPPGKKNPLFRVGWPCSNCFVSKPTPLYAILVKYQNR